MFDPHATCHDRRDELAPVPTDDPIEVGPGVAELVADLFRRRRPRDVRRTSVGTSS